MDALVVSNTEAEINRVGAFQDYLYFIPFNRYTFTYSYRTIIEQVLKNSNNHSTHLEQILTHEKQVVTELLGTFEN